MRMKKHTLRDQLHSVAAVLKNSLRIEERHWADSLPHQEAVELFKTYVELVEVETTSYCNRTCSFCPNSFIDRRSEENPMPEACWEAIVDGLREVDYDGTMVWSRYSEPTSEDRLVERIRQVRRAAPKTRICINSNGDYLNRKYLDNLIDAGLNRLWIDVYIPDTEVYDDAVAHRYHDRFLERIGRTARITGTRPELASYVDVPGLEMMIHVRNVASMVASDFSDRGGLIQLARKTSRVAPCYAPFKHLVIDWDGSVVVCCQLRSDTVKHASAVVAKIGQDGVGLVDAYVALGPWRKSLKGFGPKAAPCGSCNVYEYADNPASLLVGRLVGEEQLPGVQILKRSASRLIGKTKRL
jgi:pyruvate-formate lyase-activating enzyme